MGGIWGKGMVGNRTFGLDELVDFGAGECGDHLFCEHVVLGLAMMHLSSVDESKGMAESGKCASQESVQTTHPLASWCFSYARIAANDAAPAMSS